MKKHFKPLVAGLSFFVMAQCMQESEVQIVKTGTWRGSHVDIDVSLDWYGLFSQHDGLKT